MFRPTNVSVLCDVVVDNVRDDFIDYKHSKSTAGWFVDGGYGNDHGYLIYNNTLASAMDSGCQLTFTFEGTGVVVYGAQNAQDLAFKGVKSNGLIAISIYDLDGVTTTFASSPDIAYGVLFFQSGPLPFDNHTLTFTVTQATTESPYLLDYIGYNTTSSDVAVPLAPAQSTYTPASAIVGCALIWAATLLATITALALSRRRLASLEYLSILGRKEDKDEQPAVAEPFLCNRPTEPLSEDTALAAQQWGRDVKHPFDSAQDAAPAALTTAGSAGFSIGGRTVPYRSGDEKAALRFAPAVSECPE